MADDVVKVSFVGDSTSLNKAIDDVDRNAGRMSDSFGRVRDTALGVFSGAAILGGVEKLASGLMSASKAAREDEVAQAQLRQALQNTVGATDAQVVSVEKWISKTQNATGVLDDKLRPALGTLLRATGDVSKAQTLMSLAMDISQATGKDLESVSLALAKAHEGNVGGLQRLGISLKGANGETMEFADAQAELASLFGGAVATNLTTVEGRTQLLQARMADLQEEVGTRVNVAILAFADFMQQRVVPAIRVVVEWVQEHWPEIRDTIENVMNRVRDVITTVLETIQRFWDNWGRQIMTVVEGWFRQIRGVIEGALEVIRGVINVIMGLIHGDWDQVWDGIKQIVEGIWIAIRETVKGALEIVRGLADAGMKLVAGVFDLAWDGIKKGVEKVLGLILDGLKLWFIDIPVTVAGLAVDAGAKIVDSFWGGLKAIVGTMADFGAEILNRVLALPGEVGHHAWMLGASIVANFWNAAKEIGSRMVTFGLDIINALIGMPAALAGWAWDIGRSILDAIVDGLTGIGEAIWNKISGGISGLAGRVGGAIGGLIPGRAGGGPASGLTLVGERGPELAYFGSGGHVFNNSDTRRMLSGGGGSQSIVVNFYYPKFTSPSDSHLVANQVSRELAVALRGSVN